MTPNTKAKELLSKIWPYTEGWIDRKAVAVIMIDEVKEALREACDEEMLAIHMIYWEKVKQEIDAL
jgi:hypothetical protein